MGQPANDVLIIRIAHDPVKFRRKIGAILSVVVVGLVGRHLDLRKISVRVVDDGFLQLGLLPTARRRGGSDAVIVHLRDAVDAGVFGLQRRRRSFAIAAVRAG